MKNENTRIDTYNQKRASISLSLDPNIVKKAHDLGINISKACENQLLAMIEALENTRNQKQVGFSLSSGSLLAKEKLMAGPTGVEPATLGLKGPSMGLSDPMLSAQNVDWKAFEVFLREKSYRRYYNVQLFNLALRYSDCLFSGDYSQVQQLAQCKVPNVLRSLTNLSKFLGCHEYFLRSIKQYGLTWVSRSADDLIIDRLNRSDDPLDVWKWCLDVKECFPELNSFIELVAATGLRFSEALNCYNLIIRLTKEGTLTEKYFNANTGFLEHFRFRETFIRCSKKAYISFVPLDLLQTIGEKEVITARNPIQKHFQRRHVPQRFSDVREAHGTFMLKYLKETEVDFLHGRVSGSVFRVNYLNVKMIEDLKARASQGVTDILHKITVPKEVKCE